MSAYTDWLDNTEAHRVILLDAEALDASTSPPSTISIRQASETFIDFDESSSPPSPKIYEGRIVGSPFFQRNATEAIEGGRSLVSVGAIEFDNIDGELDDWIAYYWDGRDITLKLGDPSWSVSQFGTILTGVVERLEVVSDAVLRLIIRDPSFVVDEALQTELAEAEDSDNNVEPYCIGNVYNVEPILEDEAARRWRVHSGAMQDVCVQLYVDGKPSGIGVTKNNAAGTFTLASNPDGTVTVDAQGAVVSATFLQTPGEIGKQLLEEKGLTVVDANWSAIDSAHPYNLGIYAKERINVIDVLDALFPVGWWWGANRDGEVECGTLPADVDSETSIFTIDDVRSYGDIEIEIQEVPAWRVRVGYKKNWHVNDNPASGTTEARRDFLRNEYRIAESSDTNIRDVLHLKSRDPDLFESFIDNATHAATEAARVHALESVQRYLYTVRTFAGSMQLSIGNVVTLKDDRFNLQSGVKFVVLGITEYYLTNTVELVLWR